ncbi:MAG: ABC transporter permease [Hyphomicrobiaceae bacterium]
MRTWTNIFWLGTKELRSLFSDAVMVGLIIWAFSFSIYSQATGMTDDVHNASIAFVDEDRSTLSRAIQNAFYQPYFQRPQEISAASVEDAMNRDKFTFVVEIPPKFEEDVRHGRRPSVQINIDATAVAQASLGDSYIQNIVRNEVDRFVARSDEKSTSAVTLLERLAFNPNGTAMWFRAIVALLDQLSMITIVLTGAALLREREHGTIEHLLVMPLTAFQIAMAKVLANGVVILTAFALSLTVVVTGILQVPIAGSTLLLLAGTSVYLFAAAAIGIFLGTVARTMAQFALLMIMTILPMMMLSGGVSPIESQPELIQPVTWLLPSRHFMAFAQAVVFRGADFGIVWPEFAKVAGLGAVFFTASLALFRRSIAVSQ